MDPDHRHIFCVYDRADYIFRGAASVTKAKVTVTKAAGQTISHEIRLDGLIEAKDNFLQSVPSGLMVKSVRVSPDSR